MKSLLGLLMCVPLVTMADVSADFKKLFGGEWYDNPACKGEVAYEYNRGEMALYYFPPKTNNGAGVGASLNTIRRQKDGSYVVTGSQFSTDANNSFFATFKGNGKKMTIKGHQKKAKINTTLYNCGSKYKSIADM